MLSKVHVTQARSQAFKAFYATIRSLKNPPAEPPAEPTPPSENDFILSILRSNPSLRDTRSYLASFGMQPKKPQPPSTASGLQRAPEVVIPPPVHKATTSLANAVDKRAPQPSPVITSILNPIYQKTALVKVHGPFTDVQLDSITKGLVYLGKLGLVSVIVIENNDRATGDLAERSRIVDEVMRIVTSLERQGAHARPVVGPVARLGPKPGAHDLNADPDFIPPETHAYPGDLTPIRSSLNAGEIPVVAPLALDSFCRSVRVDANDLIAGLACGMMEAAAQDKATRSEHEVGTSGSGDVDLTPLRLMIINQHGGVPSYARSGYPHLLINLNQEYSHILETFDPKWKSTHPTALSDLALARTCLSYMPPTSSAIMVSHKSPSSLIGNLITNKPTISSSLPHALLQGNSRLTPHTPTLLRRGLPVRVIRSVGEIDKGKMTTLLEQSFGRTLDQDAFYERLEGVLDFVIIVGDYAGTAIVTKEGGYDSTQAPISYLDKFAVLPSHQGDGTVDFLWVALHDESYGLGHPFSANPNGGKGGKGEGHDLVWRSRSNNPVNKWYFERSTGHMRMGNWVLFWADGERKLKIEEGRRGSEGLSFIEDWEEGRLGRWADVIPKIPSAWSK
ncbi:mitochondrial amino-acid acetyltransferase [Coprinellus micaceus]|uniref:Amino-acid acetyltransferase, mitochondrial n=1 Tax=Coprinellus micaceus TaxID=71717 RepID=A0A4Y7TYA5_COPMI|nr:mitochondrial amino-acid acetyltransferase [Coprinellus micaceus]